jgi:two-component system response regulator MprA
MTESLKVLLIDDDQDFRASTRSLLESESHVVVEAGSGKEGLRKVLEERPDLIVLDVMMECDAEGYGVTQAIKYQEQYADCRNIPIIMSSSIELSPDERFPVASELEMIRPDFYLTKPLDIPKFLELVHRAAALCPTHRQAA